jgi:hypothetical protein
MRFKPLIGILLALIIAPATAIAQTADPDAPGDNDADDGVSDGPNRDSDAADEELSDYEDDATPGGPLPASKSDDDPAPPVAAPGSISAGSVVRQAGIGGQVGYGRAGVLELGGSFGFMAAPDFTQVSLTPEVGWFVADNFELSGRLSMTYVRAEDSMGSTSGSITTAIVEPSYHLPFNRSTFGFVGMGMGAAYVSGPGLGFAVAPRVGANFMIGRSGILTPSLSWQYTTHDQETMDTGEDTTTTTLAVSSAARFNIGYTVMW